MEERTSRIWLRIVRTDISKSCHEEMIPDHVVHRMIRGFLGTQKHPMSTSVNIFKSHMQSAITKRHKCAAMKKCTTPCTVILQNDLLVLLIKRLNLQIEGNTTILHRSVLLSEWCSLEVEDKRFGSKGPLLEQDLSGKNVIIYNHPVNSDLMSLIEKWTASKKPTRVVLIARTKDIVEWLRPANRRFLELARSISNFPLAHSCFNKHNRDLIYQDEPISILLALNKESTLLDPIDWPALKEDILEWGEKYCPSLVISDLTDKLFRERALPTHSARLAQSEIPRSFGPYQFFCHRPFKRREEKHFVECGISHELARLIDRCNQHALGLSILGILPNQLRKILKVSSDDAEAAWLDISDTLFWEGYNMWCARKKLIKAFWTNLAPQEWHKQRKNCDRKKKNVSHCTDPFHFLKKYQDLSGEKLTKCPCSEYYRSHPTKSKDIRNYFIFPRIKPLRPFDLKRQGYQYNGFTKEDRIRSEHDRGKKRKSFNMIFHNNFFFLTSGSSNPLFNKYILINVLIYSG